MSWIDTLGKPLFATRRETEEFMTAELARAVPEGWRVEREPDPARPSGVVPSLLWSVARLDPVSGRNTLSDYVVLIPASGEHVIFLHGNNDAGPGMTMQQLLRHGRVIEAWAVHRFGVAACLAEVMASCEPNQWGLT